MLVLLPVLLLRLSLFRCCTRHLKLFLNFCSFSDVALWPPVQRIALVLISYSPVRYQFAANPFSQLLATTSTALRLFGVLVCQTIFYRLGTSGVTTVSCCGMCVVVVSAFGFGACVLTTNRVTFACCFGFGLKSTFVLFFIIFFVTIIDKLSFLFFAFVVRRSK